MEGKGDRAGRKRLDVFRRHLAIFSPRAVQQQKQVQRAGGCTLRAPQSAFGAWTWIDERQVSASHHVIRPSEKYRDLCQAVSNACVCDATKHPGAAQDRPDARMCRGSWTNGKGTCDPLDSRAENRLLQPLPSLPRMNHTPPLRDWSASASRDTGTIHAESDGTGSIDANQPLPQSVVATSRSRVLDGPPLRRSTILREALTS